MYSNLLPSDAAAMLDHLTNPTNPSQFNDHWRGRYGCSDIDQENIWASTNPSPSTIDPSVSKSKGDEEKVKVTVELRFKTYEGELRTVKANVGDTLLRVARANDLPSMEGSCGGNLGMSSVLLSTSLFSFSLNLTSSTLATSSSSPLSDTRVAAGNNGLETKDGKGDRSSKGRKTDVQNAQHATYTSPLLAPFPNQQIQNWIC
jgi:hypothetical protein